MFASAWVRVAGRGKTKNLYINTKKSTTNRPGKVQRSSGNCVDCGIQAIQRSDQFIAFQRLEPGAGIPRIGSLAKFSDLEHHHYRRPKV